MFSSLHHLFSSPHHLFSSLHHLFSSPHHLFSSLHHLFEKKRGAEKRKLCTLGPLYMGSSLSGAVAVLGRSSSVPLLRYQRPWCVVPCLWDTAHKRSLAILRKEKGSDPGGGFLLSSHRRASLGFYYILIVSQLNPSLNDQSGPSH